MPTSNAKPATRKRRATAPAGGSRTAEDRAHALAQALSRDMVVISREFMLLADAVGISRSAVARILGISHTSMSLLTHDVDTLSNVRKRAVIYNFQIWAKHVERIRKKLKTRALKP